MSLHENEKLKEENQNLFKKLKQSQGKIDCIKNDQDQHQKTIEMLRSQLELKEEQFKERLALEQKKIEEKDNQIKELLAQQEEFDLLKPNLKYALEQMIKQIDESGRECVICHMTIKKG